MSGQVERPSGGKLARKDHSNEANHSMLGAVDASHDEEDSMKARMTAAVCVIAALPVAVPAAFADHGSGDDSATVTTVTASTNDDGQVTEASDATDQAGESDDDSTQAQPVSDDAAQAGQETDAPNTASTDNETDDVQLRPATVASFAAVLRNQGSGRAQHLSKPGHHHHQH